MALIGAVSSASNGLLIWFGCTVNVEGGVSRGGNFSTFSMGYSTGAFSRSTCSGRSETNGNATASMLAAGFLVSVGIPRAVRKLLISRWRCAGSFAIALKMPPRGVRKAQG